MWEYTDKVKDHFLNPRNVGIMEDADGVGEVGSIACGDALTFYFKLDGDGKIKDATFQTFGCASAIASSSALTEMVKGLTLDEAKNITNKDVANALEGLPKNKLHCSNLGADALHMAIQNFEDRKAGITRTEPVRKDEHEHSHGKDCYCPYCDVEIKESTTFCEACQRDLTEEH